MKTLLGLLLCCLIVKLGISQSQNEIGERISKTTVGIYNDSQNDLMILIGENESFLDTIILEANELWYSFQYEENPIITIFSETKFVTYTLVLSKLYRIYWDNINKHWDVKRIRRKTKFINTIE